MKLIPIIGLEIHTQLNTKSKMFCSCRNSFDIETPNKNICEICLGHPGTLPVANEKAIQYTLKAGLALNCKIHYQSKFDRKNYFYPDLPKGYQISQYDLPLCYDGYLDIEGDRIGIIRIHLEEDTAKLLHTQDKTASLIDFNRSGSPLMELVTHPDLTSAKQTKEFCQEIQRIFRYLGISTANMEKGQMRCEANISLQEYGKYKKENGKITAIDNYILNPKIELKNINSFKAIEHAIEYEINRQTKILKEGKKLIQETRGWDDSKGITFHQREKESANDYRYFPEPDIPPLNISKQMVEKLRAEIGELPIEKRKRFIQEYKFSQTNAKILSNDKATAAFTEAVLSEFKGWLETQEELQTVEDEDQYLEKINKKIAKLVGGWITSELFKLMKQNNTTIEKIKITPENFAELLTLIYTRKVNSTTAQLVLKEMFESGKDPSHIIDEKDLKQIDNEEDIGETVEKVIAKCQEQVKQYKEGKENVLMYLVGQVMKESKGKANPEKAQKILKNKLRS